MFRFQLKRDSTGVGFDSSDQFTNQWWNYAFDKAAAKISVSAGDDGVSVKCEELTNKKKEKLKEKVLYGNFIKVSAWYQDITILG